MPKNTRTIKNDFPVDLKKKGYDEHGNRWGVDPVKHLLHREGGVPALDIRAVSWWQLHGIEVITVHSTNGDIWCATLEHFIATSKPISHNVYGQQLVAPRESWNVFEPNTLFGQG